MGHRAEVTVLCPECKDAGGWPFSLLKPSVIELWMVSLPRLSQPQAPWRGVGVPPGAKMHFSHPRLGCSEK